MTDQFMLGYDLIYFMQGVKIPLYAPVGHLIVVGGSGSGKSTAVLYWLFKIKKTGCNIYICDFKASHDFIGITSHYAEFDGCYDLIKAFYTDFLTTPEGGSGKVKILLIDEIAGLLMHLGLTKEGKQKAEEIRSMMSSILMLGRSRKCFLWLSLQRFSATIFPASSGSADNFKVCCGLGRLTADGRKGLFAGEHLENEDEILFGRAKGIVLMDGQPLKALIIPQVSKKRLLELLAK